MQAPHAGGDVDTQAKRQMSVNGLRRADANTLLVLTQDVLRAPLTRVEAGTLADLLALSEVEQGLPVALKRDLLHFRARVYRELSDLPDGPPLQEFCTDLGGLQPATVPTTLREAVAAEVVERRNADSVAALQALGERWAPVEPAPVVIRVAAPPRAVTRAADPSPTRASAATSGAPRRQVLKPVEAPSHRSATPVAMVDERRVAWIEEEVMERLERYGAAGLKETMVVAAARHRSPWKDMTEKEVLTVLRKLARDNRLRFTSGRWSVTSTR